MRSRLLGREERGVELGGRLGEGAVVAVIPAEHGQRDEDLARVRDDVAVTQVAQRGRLRHETGQIGPAGLQERLGLIEREGLARLGTRERPAERVRGPLGHDGEPTTLYPYEGRGVGRGRGRGEVPARPDPHRPRGRPHDRRERGRRLRRPRAARLPRSRFGHLLAGRRLRPRTRMGTARRDLPGHGGVECAGRRAGVVQPGRPRPRHAPAADRPARARRDDVRGDGAHRRALRCGRPHAAGDRRPRHDPDRRCGPRHRRGAGPALPGVLGGTARGR